MPESPSDMSIELQQQLLVETQRLRKTLESQSKNSQIGQPKAIGSKPVENKNKVGENRMGLPAPLPVVVTDETGSDKNIYLSLIKKIEQNTSKANKARQKDKKDKKVKEDQEKDEEQRHRENIQESMDLSLAAQKKQIENAKLSLKQDREQKGIMRRWGELIRKDGTIFRSFGKAVTGKLADSITGGIRKTVGLIPQQLGLMGGEWASEIEEGMAKTAELQITAADERLKYEIMLKKKSELELADKFEKGKLTEDQYNKGVEKLTKEQEDLEQQREKLQDTLLSRAEKIQLKIHEEQSETFSSIEEWVKKQFEAGNEKGSIYTHDIHVEELLKKTLSFSNKGGNEQTSTSRFDTYTEEEEEKIERKGSRLLTSIVRELSLQNKIVQSSTDPKSNTSFNVRLTEIKQGLSFGSDVASEKKKKDAGEGIFASLLGQFRKFGTLLKGIVPRLASLGKTLLGPLKTLGTSLTSSIVPALSSLGATLGGGVAAGAAGLLGSIGAVGASLWTLKESIQTTLHLRDAEHEAIRLSNKSAENRKKTLELEAKELQTTRKELHAFTETGFDATKEYLQREGKNLSKEILEKKAEVAGGKMERLEDRMRALQRKKEQYDESSWWTKASKFATERGRVSGLSESETKELERLRKQRSQIAGSQAAIHSALSKETVQDSVAKGVIQANRNIARDKSSKPDYALENPTTQEVRRLRESLEDIFKKHTSELTKVKGESFSESLTRAAAQTPMTMPDNMMTKEPSAPRVTGVIKT